MGAFSFMPDPTADAFTPDQFMEQAYDQPFSRQTTFAGNIGQAAMETPGLGTVLKSFTIDEGRRKIARGYRAYGKGMAPDLTPETDAEVLARGDQPLTVEQYKASPSFRPEIPYDQSMTAGRAAALAEYSDRKAVVAEMARKRPITALIGSFAGSALDPINYIPIFGEASAGAAVGARVVRSAADAAANVGIAGLLSAPERARYGDDVSFSAQVSQIAMGAAVGGAFGAIGGILHQRGLARDARALAIAKDLEARLATIDNGQKAMATMAEAVEHLKNDGEINLGEGSIDRIDDLQTKTADALPAVEARQVERDKLAVSQEEYDKGIDQRARALAPETYAKVDQLETSIAATRQTLAEIEARRKAIVSPEKEMLSNRVAQLEAELQGLTGKRKTSPRAKELRETIASMKAAAENTKGQALDRAASDEVMLRMRLTEQVQDRARLGPEVNTARTKATAEADAIGMRVASPDELAARAAAAQHPDAAALRAQADDIEKKLDPAAHPIYVEMDRKAIDTLRRQADAVDAQVSAPVRQARAVLATKPKPETVPPEAVKASKEVGKPDSPKAIAEAHAVDPETGAFPEQFELAQVEKEGRMTAEDTKAMEAANENFDTAKSWGEALRAAAACLI